MKLTVELQAYLMQYSPNGKSVFEYDLPEGASVTTLVDKLGVPDELASVVIVSDENVDPTHELRDGDRVTVIPPLSGG
jgi:sulfur carrier protein ThiS